MPVSNFSPNNLDIYNHTLCVNNDVSINISRNLGDLVVRVKVLNSRIEQNMEQWPANADRVVAPDTENSCQLTRFRVEFA